MQIWQENALLSMSSICKTYIIFHNIMTKFQDLKEFTLGFYL